MPLSSMIPSGPAGAPIPATRTIRDELGRTLTHLKEPS
jgi:hypothetical protein